MCRLLLSVIMDACFLNIQVKTYLRWAGLWWNHLLYRFNQDLPKDKNIHLLIHLVSPYCSCMFQVCCNVVEILLMEILIYFYLEQFHFGFHIIIYAGSYGTWFWICVLQWNCSIVYHQIFNPFSSHMEKGKTLHFLAADSGNVIRKDTG